MTNSEVMQFVVCVQNGSYLASLQINKVYRVLPDPEAILDDFIRVIDESGEDYLYPSRYFMPVELSQDVVEAILQTA